MRDTQSVIIYKSRTEQMRDEMYQEFLQDHPDIVLWFFYLMFACVMIGILYVAIKVFQSERKW